MATVSKSEVLQKLSRPGLISESHGKIMVFPESTEEIASVLALANEAKLLVEISGAGTKRAWGSRADTDVILDTKRLAGVTEHSWQDLTCTVRAGTPWSEMQNVLATYKQQVALDPLWPETATVAGVVATNDSGALRLKFGSLRDLIIGMTIVLADGTVAKSGGKVVKNVAGYDLHKLMIGAFGTLGVIADVTFRLHPIPAHKQCWTFESDEAAPATGVMMKVLDSHLSAQAMQLRTRADAFALDVELATMPDVLLDHGSALQSLAEAAGLAIQNAGEGNPFSMREELFKRQGGVILKLTMLPSLIGEVSDAVKRLGGASVTQASGVMFARFEDESAAKEFSQFAMVACSQAGGSVRVIRSSGDVTPLGATAVQDNTRALMQQVKSRFDPNHILNPSRGVGGI